MNQPRVVVADHDDDTRRLLGTALRGDGCDVTEARDGRELLRLLTQHPAPDARHPSPDLIVTDVRMPKMDGLSILFGLREAGWTTPIILISAFATEVLRAQASALRVDAFFAKPFDIDDVRCVALLLLGTTTPPATSPSLPDIC